MRVALLLLLLAPIPLLTAQPAEAPAALDRYLDSIRDQPAALRAFFWQMPKGGDLHHHFEGAIYGETLLEGILAAGYWIDTSRLAIAEAPAAEAGPAWTPLDSVVGGPAWPGLRRRLLQRWSVLDYRFDPADPPDAHFFGAFPALLPAVPAVTETALLRLKERALAENVQYLETIFLPFACPETGISYPEAMDGEMRSLVAERDARTLFQLFDKIYGELEASGLETCAREHTQRIERRHQALGLDDEGFHLRYQNYVVRVLPPTQVFTDLAVNFVSAAQSPLIVGVNIVAPEHDPVALDDYWLHMQMYRYLGDRFPRVARHLHAGELVPGQVPPEHLTHHINEAVALAGAGRIGHGVTLPYERDSQALLRRMADRGIAVEINPSSNHFILGLPIRDIPLLLYRRHNVPVVISTDDPGVLRSTLTEQYVLLAQAFPELRYRDFRAFARNSIQYSALDEPAVKDQVLRQLDRALAEFEERIRQDREN